MLVEAGLQKIEQLPLLEPHVRVQQLTQGARVVHAANGLGLFPDLPVFAPDPLRQRVPALVAGYRGQHQLLFDFEVAPLRMMCPELAEVREVL